MHLKEWYATFLFVLAACWSPHQAATHAETLPGFAIPDRLKPYADERGTFENARAVIALLKGAEFVRDPNGLDSDCNTDDVESFYRGMHIAHLGYYLLLSKQEVGWFEDQSPTQADPPRAFVDFGRNVLLRVWTPRMLAKALDLSSTVGKWPPERRADLVRFLTILRDFRAYHANVLRSRDDLDALYSRLNSDSTLRYWRIYMPGGGIQEMKNRFPGREPMNFDAELRDLVNKVRGADQPPIEPCFEAGAPYTITLEDSRDIKSSKLLLPISYMLRFWDRREAEGTSALAAFLLTAAISQVQP